MLPDLPGLKEELQEILNRYLRRAIRQRMGVFATVPQHTVHEGQEMRVYRADGTSEDTGMKEAYRSLLPSLKGSCFDFSGARGWLERQPCHGAS